jgi:hypothetical protein
MHRLNKLESTIVFSLLVFLSGAAPHAAHAADYQMCEITYEYEYKVEGEHADRGTHTRSAKACVNDQTDCHRRGAGLARQDAKRREVPPYDHGRVNMSTIRVTHITTEGTCEQLD